MAHHFLVDELFPSCHFLLMILFHSTNARVLCSIGHKVKSQSILNCANLFSSRGYNSNQAIYKNEKVLFRNCSTLPIFQKLVKTDLRKFRYLDVATGSKGQKPNAKILVSFFKYCHRPGGSATVCASTKSLTCFSLINCLLTTKIENNTQKISLKKFTRQCRDLNQLLSDPDEPCCCCIISTDWPPSGTHSRVLSSWQLPRETSSSRQQDAWIYLSQGKLGKERAYAASLTTPHQQGRLIVATYFHSMASAGIFDASMQMLQVRMSSDPNVRRHFNA